MTSQRDHRKAMKYSTSVSAMRMRRVCCVDQRACAGTILVATCTRAPYRRLGVDSASLSNLPACISSYVYVCMCTSRRDCEGSEQHRNGANANWLSTTTAKLWLAVVVDNLLAFAPFRCCSDPSQSRRLVHIHTYTYDNIHTGKELTWICQCAAF